MNPAKHEPGVSVVIETVTARYDADSAESLSEDLARVLRALRGQTYPTSSIEPVVVVDAAMPSEATSALCESFPEVVIAFCEATNYCAAKNAGAETASGELVAFLDGDCLPERTWLRHLVGSLDDSVQAVAGRTTYETDLKRSTVFSITDFGHVGADDNGEATGFNINNVLFRRDEYLKRPLNPRVRRNGGCTLLFHQMRAGGSRIVYAPEARIAHATGDIRCSHFLRKHFGRGFDSVDVYRLDNSNALRGSRYVRRFGPLALIAITARRILKDWRFLAGNREQLDVSFLRLPLVAAAWTVLRMIELAGMITRVFNPGFFDARDPLPH